MKTIQYILILFFLSGISYQSYGQQALTLQEALQYALNNSEAVQKARLDIEKGEYKVAEVRASALPQIDATSNMTYNIQKQKFLLPAVIAGGPEGEFLAVEAGTAWSAMTQVQLNQQIFNQQVFTGLKAAKSSAEFYRLAANLAEENLMQQVATNYYMVIINREKLEVIDANIERVKKLESMVKSQYEVGLAKKIDYDRVKVNLSNLIADRQTMVNAVEQQLNLLKYYMGMPINDPLVLPESGVEELEEATNLHLAGDGFNPESLTEFKVLKKQEDLLNFQKKAYAAEYYPSLMVGANYTYSSQTDAFNMYTNKALNYGMSGATLTLRIPIFDGNARGNKIKQAKVDILQLQEDLRSTRNSLNMAHKNAQIQIQNSLNTIESQKANRELAEEVYNSTQNNYHNGLASLTDLLAAETDLVSAQNSYNEALLNFKVAQIELIKSNGNIKTLISE